MTTHFESIHVDSSVMSKVSYDKLFCHLFVNFNDGKIYRYVSVPSSVFEAFRSAKDNGESIGKLFNASVRDNYAYDLL